MIRSVLLAIISAVFILLGDLAWTEEAAQMPEGQRVEAKEVAIGAEVRPKGGEPLTDQRAIYTVGVGDVLTVRLREGAKVTENDVTVMSSGTIVISCVEIDAAGHTIPEIRKKAQEELAKYIKDFSVDLIVKEWRDRKIFVLGEVQKPGVYSFSAGMTTVQAIALAGGLKNTARVRDTRIIRGNLDNPELIHVNLEGAARGKDTRDILLAQNDVIYVPRSAIGDWNNFINLYIRPTLEVFAIPVSGAATVKGLAE